MKTNSIVACTGHYTYSSFQVIFVLLTYNDIYQKASNSFRKVIVISKNKINHL